MKAQFLKLSSIKARRYDNFLFTASIVLHAKLQNQIGIRNSPSNGESIQFCTLRTGIIMVSTPIERLEQFGHD